jgi:hypothetical protein
MSGVVARFEQLAKTDTPSARGTGANLGGARKGRTAEAGRLPVGSVPARDLLGVCAASDAAIDDASQ